MISPAMVDQIHLTEARAIFCPVYLGANRNAPLQQGARLREPTVLSGCCSVPGAKSIHPRRADREQVLVTGQADLEDTGLVQSGQLNIQGSPQSLGASTVEQIGQDGDRLRFLDTVTAASWPANRTLHSFSSTAENRSRVSPMIPGGLHEFIQDSSPLSLTRQSIATLELSEVFAVRSAHEVVSRFGSILS
jgi:hypothetical protein